MAGVVGSWLKKHRILKFDLFIRFSDYYMIKKINKNQIIETITTTEIQRYPSPLYNKIVTIRLF